MCPFWKAYVPTSDQQTHASKNRLSRSNRTWQFGQEGSCERSVLRAGVAHDTTGQHLRNSELSESSCQEFQVK